MTRFFSKLKTWFAKLAFWHKPRVAPEDAEDPESTAPVRARASRLSETERGETPATPAPKPGWLTRLKQGLRLRRTPVAEKTLDPDKTVVVEKPTRERLAPVSDTDEAGEASAPTAKPRWLAWLNNFWRIRRAPVAAEALDADETVVIEKPSRERLAPPSDADESEDTSEPATKPRWLAWLNNFWRIRRAPVAEEALDADKTVVIEKPSRERLAPPSAVDEAGETDEPAPRPPRLAWLKNRLRLRRKSDAPEAATEDQEAIVEKRSGSAASNARREAEADQESEEDAPKPSRLKRMLAKLRNKWVWVPATGLASLALIAGVIMAMVNTTHETKKLEAELRAAQKKLAQKAAAPIVAAKVTPPIQAALGTPPAKPGDPAFEIVGHVAAETNADIDASDCVVKSKESVAQNLKHCIEGFNSAMASSPQKTGQP